MTNSNLIAVFNGTIANQPVQLANAQSLHSFLEVQSKFADWIKNRITDYGFVQDEDYIIVTERTAGRPRKEYHITLDMGKELAMVERNEKGRQIRKYFIECERQALQKTEQIAPLVLPEKPRKIQGATRAAEGEYLYTREFSALEIDQLADLWDVAEQQYNFILSLIPLFESMQSEHWLKKLSIAKSAFETPHMSYPVLAGICEDIEEYTGMSPSIRLKKRMERRFSRF